MGMKERTKARLRSLEADVESYKSEHENMRNTIETLMNSCSAKDELIKQMKDALQWALTEARSTHGENLIKATLEAAERGGQ